MILFNFLYIVLLLYFYEEIWNNLELISQTLDFISFRPFSLLLLYQSKIYYLVILYLLIFFSIVVNHLWRCAIFLYVKKDYNYSYNISNINFFHFTILDIIELRSFLFIYFYSTQKMSIKSILISCITLFIVIIFGLSLISFFITKMILYKLIYINGLDMVKEDLLKKSFGKKLVFTRKGVHFNTNGSLKTALKVRSLSENSRSLQHNTQNFNKNFKNQSKIIPNKEITNTGDSLSKLESSIVNTLILNKFKLNSNTNLGSSKEEEVKYNSFNNKRDNKKNSIEKKKSPLYKYKNDSFKKSKLTLETAPLKTKEDDIQKWLDVIDSDFQTKTKSKKTILDGELNKSLINYLKTSYLDDSYEIVEIPLIQEEGVIFQIKIFEKEDEIILMDLSDESTFIITKLDNGQLIKTWDNNFFIGFISQKQNSTELSNASLEAKTHHEGGNHPKASLNSLSLNKTSNLHGVNKQMNMEDKIELKSFDDVSLAINEKRPKWWTSVLQDFYSNDKLSYFQDINGEASIKTDFGKSKNKKAGLILESMKLDFSDVLSKTIVNPLTPRSKIIDKTQEIFLDKNKAELFNTGRIQLIEFSSFENMVHNFIYKKENNFVYKNPNLFDPLSKLRLSSQDDLNSLKEKVILGHKKSLDELKILENTIKEPSKLWQSIFKSKSIVNIYFNHYVNSYASDSKSILEHNSSYTLINNFSRELEHLNRDDRDSFIFEIFDNFK